MPPAPAGKPRTAAPPPKWVWGLVMGSLALTVTLCGVLAYVYFGDDPPPDDQDLLTPPPMVANDTNGFYQIEHLDTKPLDLATFAEGKGLSEDEAEDLESGKTTNDPIVEEFLAQAQPTLAQVDAALQLPNFEYSRTVSIRTMVNVQSFTRAAKTMVRVARVTMKHGDVDSAIRELNQVHLLAKRMANAHGGLIVLLIAESLQSQAQNVVVDWINDPTSQSKAFTTLQPIITDDIGWREKLQYAIRLEYQMAHDTVLTMRDHPEAIAALAGDQSDQEFLRRLHGLSYLLKPNRTLRAIAKYDRKYAELAGLNASDMVRRKSELPTFKKMQVWDVLRPNGLGQMLMGLMIPSFGLLIDHNNQSIAETEIVRIALASRQYYDKNQKLPANLGDLVPAYLPSVPQDPFDSQPLRYNAAKGLIYSVGASLKDSGGSRFLTMAKDDDEYEEPINDPNQPTLQLTFQNPSTAKAQSATNAK